MQVSTPLSASALRNQFTPPSEFWYRYRTETSGSPIPGGALSDLGARIVLHKNGIAPKDDRMTDFLERAA